jgi:coenzyme PQQ precursor peptide PqqA
MKIMRLESMIYGYSTSPLGSKLYNVPKGMNKLACREPVTSRRLTMKWQTPAATDMRFGFEITMYIANR